MIQATDLRLNNWIASGKEYSETSLIGKVRQIGEELTQFEQIYCECEESFEWFFKDNYCGIPLSPDILIKAGFKKEEPEGWFIKKRMPQYADFRLFMSCEGDFHFPDGEFVPDVFYLHQLQNLYFALTGLELTINL